jgi:hypothetical protein
MKPNWRQYNPGMARRRDDLAAAALLLAAITGTALLWRNHAFRSFFSWPYGSVWPNFVQAALWVFGAGFAGWYLRDHVGRGLVGWLGRHHEPLLAKHHDQIKDGLKPELRSIDLQLAEIRSAVRSLHTRLDGN